MLKCYFKRFLALALVISFLGGILSPTQVYAFTNSTHGFKYIGAEFDVDAGLRAQAGELLYFYKDNVTEADNQFTSSGGLDLDIDKDGTVDYADKRSILTFKLGRDSGRGTTAKETVAWASPEIIKNKFKFNNNWPILDETVDDSFTKIVAKIDDSLGSSSYSSLFTDLNNLSASLGISTADLSNINQRLAAIAFMQMNPQFFMKKAANWSEDNPTANRSATEYAWPDIQSIDESDYKELLSITLDNTDDKTFTQYLVAMEMATKADDIEDTQLDSGSKVNSKSFGYSVVNAGIFALDLTSKQHNTNTDSLPTLSADNKVFLSNNYAFYQIMKELCSWWLNEMPDIVASTNWAENDEVKATLTYLRIMDDAFGELIPVIDRIYKEKNKNADDKSIEDMVQEADVANMTIQDAFSVDVSKFTEHTDHTSPVAQFYTVNSDLGITSYDLDKIVSDIEVDHNLDLKNLEELEDQRRNEVMTGQSSYNVDDYQLTQQISVANDMTTYLEAVMKDYNEWAKGKDDPNFDDYWADLKDKKKDSKKDFWKKNVVAFYNLFKNNRNDAIIDVVVNHYKSTNPDWGESVYDYVDQKQYKQLFQMFYTGGLQEDPNTEGKFTTYKYELNGPGQDIKSLSLKDDKLLATLKKSMDKTAENNAEALAEAGDNLVNYGVDENGHADHFGAVTINKFIIEGMGYSASYVPMRTNLYSADTLARYMNEGEETDFYKFYTDFGFMRKALFKDTSSSSVMDYYNAGNVFSGNLQVCTLRDLIELGDGDLSLYIDPNFYNAKQAAELGNQALKNRYEVHKKLFVSLSEFASVWKKSSIFSNHVSVMSESITDDTLRSAILSNVDEEEGDPNNPDAEKRLTLNFDDLQKDYSKALRKAYKFSIEGFNSEGDLAKYNKKLSGANNVSDSAKIDDIVLKNGDNTSYDSATRSYLADCEDSAYVNLSDSSDDFSIDLTDDSILTQDNPDSVVLSSAQINQYMSGQIQYSETVEDEENQTKTTNTYTSDLGYTPLISLAYVSCLYRDIKNYNLANTVATNVPVFMASKDMCGIDEANQWYCNTLLNYLLVKNLKNNAQVDVSYVTDLDNPVYMDIFGNIITESGIVVIPAASNATLHVGSFRDYNYSLGLYTCYGSCYELPADTKGAAAVLEPFFQIDPNSKTWKINGITMSVNGNNVRFDKLDTYDQETQDAVKLAYMASTSQTEYTRMNWVAMVNIINEVMRGAPIEAIDKMSEGIESKYTKSGLVAAAKLESLEKSLKGQMSNTLLCIPDFSRMDNMEYWIALLIKLMMVATAAVVIIAIYRDGAAQTLGVHTAAKCLFAVALTFSCIVVVPSVFQLTYYAANKFMLGNEVLRILMVNEEKRQSGAEIGITEVNSVDSTGEFALQLDWVTVPWYEELENMLYSSTLDNLQEVKLKAYRETPTYDNEDVSLYNDGVYVTTDALFDSVSLDYTFSAYKNDSNRGLYLYANNDTQTASFYSPYYVFLRTLTANVNEYNRYRNVFNGDVDVYDEINKEKPEESKSSWETALQKGEEKNAEYKTVGAYNYTTKYMSGNRLKTVGLCKAYFESPAFMETDEDIMRLQQIYMAENYDSKIYNSTAGTAKQDSSYNKENTKSYEEEAANYQENILAQALNERESTTGRALLYSATDRDQFRASYWFDNNLLNFDSWSYNRLTKESKKEVSEGSAAHTAAQQRYEYIDEKLENFYRKADAMDAYAREFVANNKDMLNKVTDETFIKVMALAMAIKYNQLFGVPTANAVEIFNMDSNDLLRLCIVPSDDAALASSMSYPRYVYSFGGEPSIYVAAILSIVLWVGSFIKPLCTIIVFISVFMSIFVFRVVLQKPSANLWGYFVTTMLLCATNIFHAILLKVGVALPNFGLPTMGCLIFITVGQVAYLLILAYVTGIALKDWSNLGAAEYEKDAKFLRHKFGSNPSSDMLSGKIKHYDNNWDYYNSLVSQHRSRNTY